MSRNFFAHLLVKFTCVNKIEAMYERSRVNVKTAPRSTFMSTRDTSYVASILYTRVKYTCIRT